MTPQVLYVYAIGRSGHAVPERMEVVDGSDHIAAVDVDGLTAFYTAVNSVEFSQPVIDSRSKDVEWLGAIGYRHQSVMAALMQGGTVIPLRAFTLFASETTLRSHLHSERQLFKKILERLDGNKSGRCGSSSTRRDGAKRWSAASMSFAGSPEKSIGPRRAKHFYCAKSWTRRKSAHRARRSRRWWRKLRRRWPEDWPATRWLNRANSAAAPFRRSTC